MKTSFTPLCSKPASSPQAPKWPTTPDIPFNDGETIQKHDASTERAKQKKIDNGRTRTCAPEGI
jgi:hypothetical protein